MSEKEKGCENSEAQETFAYFDSMLSKNGRTADASHIDWQDRDWREILDRNATYSQFILTYTMNSNRKAKYQSKMKVAFFAVIMILLSLLVAAACVAMVHISNKASPNAEDSVTVITAISGVIASFIVIPKAIANNLFPNAEDDKTAQIFGDMIKSDLELRKYYLPLNKNDKGEK